MSRYSSAFWKPIRATSTVAVTKDILCFHTGVGSATSIWSYFDRLDVGVYSHGIVGGIWGADAGKDLDGVAWQMADTDFRAAANLDGNWRVISWETADNAVRPIAPWTPKQCDKIVQIMVDAHQIDGIPLVLIPDTKLGRRGVAYHRLGCDPYRVAGGELWSSSFGKDCPTDPRIQQLPGLLARAQAIVAGDNTNKGVFMALTDAEQVEVLRGARASSHVDLMLSQNNTAGDVNAILANDQSQGTAIAALAQGLTDVQAQLAQVLALLQPAPPVQ